MISADLVFRRASLLAALAVVLVLPGGCAAFGEPAGAEAKVEVLEVESPLREPVWVPEKKTLLALGEEEPRMVLVDPDSSEGPAVAHSRRLDGLGGEPGPQRKRPGSRVRAPAGAGQHLRC